jgi:fructose transport system permease protein
MQRRDIGFMITPTPRNEPVVEKTSDSERTSSKSSSETIQPEEEKRSLIKRFQIFVHHHSTFVPLIIFLATVLAFGIADGTNFLSLFNISLVIQQVTIIAVVGIAQSVIILTAGIDISVGAILVLSQMVMARLAVQGGVPVEAALVAGFAVGTLCGLFNGTLVTVFNLPPFIATLGTWSIFGALNIWYSSGETVPANQIATTAPLLQLWGKAIRIYGAGMTSGLIILALLYFVTWHVLNKTALGRHIYATGDNIEAARLAGINTRRTLLAVYTIGGFISALGGWVLIGRVGAASPLSGGTLNLDSITAVVVGGTSLFGGRGSIIGTLIGALIVGVFRNGLALGGADVVWQDFSVGLLILVAVSIDQWIRRVAE